jgi:hypothetical protein
VPRSKLSVLTPPAQQAQPASPPSPRAIPDDAVHPLPEWGQILQLPRHTLRREVRLGRLRASKRAGKLWSTGLWIKQWIESGEVKRRPAAASGNGHSD